MNLKTHFRFLTLAIAIFMAGCSPSDVKVKTVRERLEAGELVEFTKPGYRRPSCPRFAPDWSEVLLNDQSERERIVLKTQQSSLNPGKDSCYRVGSVVALEVNGSKNGRARIRKFGVVKLAAMKTNQLKGKFFSKTDESLAYLKKFAEKLRPSHEGYVTIVDLEYLPSSATDEKAIREKEEEKNAGDGYQESTEDGTRVGECRNNSVWNEILVPKDLQTPILEGRLKSWYRLGNFNCLNQGQDVDVKERFGADVPSVGKVKIRKVKLFKIRSLARERFDLPDFDFDVLKARILEENAKKSKPEEFIIVYDVQGPGGVITPIECRPDTITAMEGADRNARRFQTVVPKGTCLKVGHLVMVLVPLEEGKFAEVPAKVVSVEERTEGIFITVERVQGGQR